MISRADKLEALTTILAYKFVQDKHVQELFRTLIIHADQVLDRVHFTHRSHLNHYYLKLNVRTGSVLIAMRGKLFRDTQWCRVLKQVILRTQVPLFLSIDTSQGYVKALMNNLDYQQDLLVSTLFEMTMSYLIHDYRTKELKTLIDQALDDRDVSRFQELTNELRQLHFLIEQP